MPEGEWVSPLIESTELIASGEMVVEGRFVDASNATLFAHCSRGEEQIAVIYKPIAGERPLWDFPDGNLASRERAAYLLSEYLELHVVPFTILREGPFGPGMVQEWIEIDEEIDVVEVAQGHSEAIRKMALFDAIINNTDRKYGHILIPQRDTIFGCDHGVTFHSEPKLRTVIWQFTGQAFTDDEKAILKSSLNMDDSLLAGLITQVEIRSLKERVHNLLDGGVFPYPSEEWPSIPWPPF